MLKWLKDKICPSDKHEILSLEITIENFGGKELMKKKYIRVYKARFPHRGKVSTMSGDELYAECLDIELRIICQEIINDEEFKKAIVVLEKK